MSVSEEEQQFIIDSAIDTLNIDIIGRGYMTIDELVSYIEEKLRDMQ